MSTESCTEFLYISFDPPIPINTIHDDSPNQVQKLYLEDPTHKQLSKEIEARILNGDYELITSDVNKTPKDPEETIDERAVILSLNNEFGILKVKPGTSDGNSHVIVDPGQQVALGRKGNMWFLVEGVAVARRGKMEFSEKRIEEKKKKNLFEKMHLPRRR